MWPVHQSQQWVDSDKELGCAQDAANKNGCRKVSSHDDYSSSVQRLECSYEHSSLR